MLKQEAYAIQVYDCRFRQSEFLLRCVTVKLGGQVRGYLVG